MKNLFLLIAIILIAIPGYTQERSPAFYKLLLQQFKTLPVKNSKGRDLILKEVEKEMPNINDSLILADYQSLINDLKKREFKETKSKGLGSLSRMDLKGFKVKEDKFQKVTFITPLGSMTTGKDPLEIYLVIDDNDIVDKRLKIRYSGKDWVFMDKILFLINDDVFTYNLNEKTDRDVSGGYVYEYSDELITEDLQEIINKVIDSDGEISIRFQGDNYYDQRISKSNILRLKKSVTLFQKLAYH